MLILEEMKKHYKPDVSADDVMKEMKKVFARYA